MHYDNIKNHVNGLDKLGVNKIILIGGELTLYDRFLKHFIDNNLNCNCVDCGSSADC